MTPDVARRIDAAAREVLGAAVESWRSVSGGYTSAACRVCSLDDGRTAFAKAADGGWTARWLRSERKVLAALPTPFVPRVLGWWQRDGLPVLFLEDLSTAHWPPPWRDGDVDRVLTTLDNVAGTPVEVRLPAARDALGGARDWQRLAEDPDALASTGLAARGWIDAALPKLRAAAASAPIEGDALLHLDVRSDNLCLAPDRVVLVDWNWACRGDARLDPAFWAPSLHLEGGPRPEQVVPDEPGLAAVVAGFLAASAAFPRPEAPTPIRKLHHDQARVALAWAARELGVPPPA